MKVSNIGIILLTLLVVIRYTLIPESMNLSDGSFSSGISFNYDAPKQFLASMVSDQNRSELVAIHTPKLENEYTLNKRKNNRATGKNEGDITDPIYFAQNNENTSGPAPMEYANTLVVYNPENPAISNFNTKYIDPEDSQPLDHGNTLVNEFQMMMPRR